MDSQEEVARTILLSREALETLRRKYGMYEPLHPRLSALQDREDPVERNGQERRDIPEHGGVTVTSGGLAALTGLATLTALYGDRNIASTIKAAESVLPEQGAGLFLQPDFR